jgi:hypothetical protein
VETLALNQAALDRRGSIRVAGASHLLKAKQDILGQQAEPAASLSAEGSAAGIENSLAANN